MSRGWIIGTTDFTDTMIQEELEIRGLRRRVGGQHERLALERS